jgi:uncharacterized protein HemY
VIRRINAKTTVATLRTHWNGVATAYKNNPEIHAAKEARKAALE